MSAKSKLSRSMTIEQFDKGYWYVDEIKGFAKTIGIANSAKLRKDELEHLIKHFLRTGKVLRPQRKNVVKKGAKDLDAGLKTSLPIVLYTSNKQTKNFIISEAEKIMPDFRVKSGIWYRLNRWRDDQITKGRKITYGDLINQFIRLSQSKGKFEKIPAGRYINFLADFLANENKATRQQAIAEWKKLKNA